MTSSKFKRASAFFLLVCICGSFFCIRTDASDMRMSWYCKRNKDHTQPTLDTNMAYIEQHNAFYVDRAHDHTNEDKVIYLTFDAGYENGNVAKILDVLKAENVKASFFILENLIRKNTDLVIRMGSEGHTVCNHTATHKDMSRVTDKEIFKEELEKLERTYREYTGREIAKIYRPPEGRFSEESLRFADELGYKTVFWSFAYADWDNAHQMSIAAAKKKILDNVHNGEIMLLHPTSSTNAAILGDVIRELKMQGYRFSTLDALGKKEGEL